MKFNTKTIHGGQSFDPGTGAIMTPIHQSSTFAQSQPGVHKGFEYSRGNNPTRAALENALASIENGSHGFAFSSGLAAIDCVLRLLNPGDDIITGNDLYGGTYRLFTQVFKSYGLNFIFVDTTDLSAVSKAITNATKLIWLETPTNPLMKIADITEITKVIKNKNPDILVGVDNTFATPYLQRPLSMGVDIVMHSATKYIGGHSDLVMGALIVNDAELAKKLHFIQFAAGAIAGPMDSFLALRGIKTLHVRMQRHCENAKKISKFLLKHPKVSVVYYPGLSSHPHHDIAKKQMDDFGGMVSFRLKDDSQQSAYTFLENTQLFTLAESLGGVESLVNHPITMSHASVPKSEQEKNGITNALIRLSVGIEDCDDLVADLAQALEK